MARRNRVNQGPLVIIILVIVAAWLFRQSGATSLLTPAGMLLLLTLALVLNAMLRKKTRAKSASKSSTPTSYGNIPRRAERNRHTRSQRAFSRTTRAAKPETWPYDGSYCVHCGLKKRGEKSICPRCHQPINYSA